MGDALLVRKTGGGSAELPAIYVTYPEGSICTCSKGSKTYTAKDTSGYWLFAGLEVGEWTLTISDPTGTYEDRSTTTTITDAGEVVSVELAWNVVLFSNGDQNTAVTGGWGSSGYVYYDTSYNVVAPTIGNNIVASATGSPNVSIAGTSNAIDLTGISQIAVDVSAISGTCHLTVNKTKNTHASVSDATLSFSKTGVLYLQTSTLPAGSYYIAVSAITSSAVSSSSVSISTIIAERG